MVRRGVVRPGCRRQTRIRIVGCAGCGQGVVVMRMRREVDAEGRWTGSGRLRHAVRRRKIRRLEVGGGIGTDVARRSMNARTTAGAGRRQSTRAAVLRAFQRPQLAG